MNYWKKLCFLGVSLICFCSSASAQCDDDDIPSGFLSYSGPACAGSTVFLIFNLFVDDDDTELFDVVYTLNGQLFALNQIPNGYAIPIVLNTSTVAILVTVEADDCEATINHQLLMVSYPLPVLTATALSNPSCGLANGSIEVMGSNGSPPYQYRLNNGPWQASGFFTGLPAGAYEITLRDAQNCTDQLLLQLASTAPPVLNTLATEEPSCGLANGSIEVLGSNGSPPYQYRLNNGPWQASGLFTGLPAGAYEITLRDAQNCTDQVLLQLLTDTSGLSAASIVLPDAALTWCLNTPLLVAGNLSGIEEGNWTATPASSVSFQDATSPETEVSFSMPGNYELYWSLSLDDCLDYSVDTLQVVVANSEIDAVDDGPIALQQDTLVQVQILQNDFYPAQVEVEIVGPAQLGTAFMQGAILNYQSGITPEGFDSLTYQICSLPCPEICDTAKVFFQIESADSPCDLTDLPASIFPEGITPNGDGYNDYLVFQIVDPADCPFVYQNSEMVIFNRWGDQVFQASPYDNNWDGRYQGALLPAGVYYYVLRVPVMDYKRFGTVTIFR